MIDTRAGIDVPAASPKQNASHAKSHNAVITYAHASPEAQHAFSASERFAIPKVGELVSGQVLDISKNGIVVTIGGTLTGLVRGKELDDESGVYSKLSIGDAVEATVLDIENEQGMLELSFRQAGHRKAWDSLAALAATSEVVDAKVVDANKGGLMVKVGNVEGFLPVSQLTVEHYPRVEGGDKNRILDRLRAYVGEVFHVKVITVREREEKLIVSEKAAWEREQHKQLARFAVGDEVSGRATGVVDFGVFVEFGDGLEGLVHISELAWQRIDNPADLVAVGDQIRAKIISIDNGKVSLSVKRMVPDPWKQAADKYKVGDTVSGTVLKLNPYGAFVELDPDIHGLAHISELAKNSEQDLSKLLAVGEKRPFKILSIEPAAHRLGLGLA